MPCAHEICKCEDESFVFENLGYCSEVCAHHAPHDDCVCEHEECLVRPFRPQQSSAGAGPTSSYSPTLGGD